MPGPRAKQNVRKKSKPKVTLRFDAAGLPAQTLESELDKLPDGDWDKVTKVLCDHLKLPDLNTRAGLKKVFHDFHLIHERMEYTYSTYVANHIVRGGIVAIYAKMSADSILRNMIFRRGLFPKIIDLIDKPNSLHLALRALVTVTQHGGPDVRKEICLQASVVVNVLEDFPDDLYAAELAISTLAHAITCSLDEFPNKRETKYLKPLQLSKLVPLVLGFLGKPGISLPLLHHALELFVHLTQHCGQECQAFPDMVDFLVASIRSSDMYSRFCALGGVIRAQAPVPEKVGCNPYILTAAMRRGLQGHLLTLLREYGLSRCDSTLTIQCGAMYEKAIMRYVEDRDLYTLGLALAELIPRTELAIGEGAFMNTNESTESRAMVDLGLPSKSWVDVLPLCAKAIRKRGKVGEDVLADMLDMKFFVGRSRVPEAIPIAFKGIERDPKQAYPYYILSLGGNFEEVLRYAKKGLKCKNATPFLRHALRARATEIAGELAICRMQESDVSDQRWEQAQAFLESALDDAQIYLSQAPPDMRQRRNVLSWYLILTLAKRGPELSIELHELNNCFDNLKIADEFLAEFGMIYLKSQLRMAQERIIERYAAAAQKWGAVVARFDNHDLDAHVLPREKSEDRFAAWLNDVRDEHGDNQSHPKLGHWDGHGHGRATGTPSHAGERPTSATELYRCSWCGNPSAVLRKCAGCQRARYCDHDCQKLAWSEHKGECKSHKAENSCA